MEIEVIKDKQGDVRKDTEIYIICKEERSVIRVRMQKL